MKRLDDWPERLAAFLESDAPFEWGKHDCCLFVCDAIRAMTGVDVASDFRGKYKSELGAARMLARRGGVAGIAAKVTAEYGMEEIAPALARRGDVGLAGEPAALAIIGMNGYAVSTGLTGRVLVDRAKLVKAWRV